MKSSAGSTSTRPPWPPPRSPLPPHRLAKLANALGISTPLPMMVLSSPTQSHPGNSPASSSTDLAWRSVTPSTATALNLVSPAQSKYFLHVIPPVHLPHDFGSTDLAPSASGYHIQFRRGTLVALQSTLQAQLVLIAREYALPSTIGIVLYLATAAPVPPGDTGGEEAGPRLSEEIWRKIWSRVLRAERDDAVPLSRSGTPSPFGLGLSVKPTGLSPSLRPLLTPTRTEQPSLLACPITPSTSNSTASSLSDVRSHGKSAGASSEPNTPDTSRSSDHGPLDIELPGLSSPSIVPILAKVEFDIDRRKATWYEPWVRSRRIKRVDSRSGHRSESGSRTLASSSPVDEKRAPNDLKLVQRMHNPPFLRSQDDSDEDQQHEDGGYAPLSESPDADEAAYMTSTVGLDPLGDVFGTDAETWAEFHAESDMLRRRSQNPNVVDLALDATSLTALPEEGQDEGTEDNDVDEVRIIMRHMSRPRLSVSIPDSAESKRRSSVSTAGVKRPVPPPLNLTPISPTDDLVEGASEAVDFRGKEGSSLEIEQEYQRSRGHGEEKRVGTVFEDLDLGLDLGDDDEEYDENDPNDRRRSQYLMKAKLDEIERTLAQFSPQMLRTTAVDDDPKEVHRHDLSAVPQPHMPSPVDSLPASPLPNVWPSVPYATVSNVADATPHFANRPLSPPRLALNGVSAGAPKAFMTASDHLSTMPTESQVRRRELEQSMYPATIPSLPHPASMASDSPIPLPPDPFGRHPSVYEVNALPMQSYWEPFSQSSPQEPVGFSPPTSSVDDVSDAANSATPSSRFSADSSSVVDPSEKTVKSIAPLVSVKNFKKLWRRSKSSPSALPEPSTPGRASFQIPGSPQPPTPIDQYMEPPLGTIARGTNELPSTLHPPRPSLSGSRPNSPGTHLNVPPSEKSSIRKSIMKSFKSVAGVGSQQSSNGAEPRRSSERVVSNETIKARRPSVLDGSMPPSPQLPEEFLASNHVRTGSNFFEHRKSAPKIGSGRHHLSASHDLLSTVPSVLYPNMMRTPGTAPSSQLHFPISPRDSYLESRPGLEASQFEIITPPKVHPNLTYPYTVTLDHE